MTLAALVVVAALVVAGCGGARLHTSASVSTAALPCADYARACPDGRPVYLIQSLYCQGGICGFTCAPERWGVAH